MSATTVSLGFPEILRHDVRCFGDKVAVTIDEDGLTYRQLAELVATTRQRIGAFVGPGDRVGLWLPNSFAWIAGFLAAIELGAIVVPVNTRLTTSEVGVILKDAGTRLLITTDAYRGRAYGEEAVDSFDADCASVVLVIPDGELNGEWRSHVRSGPRDVAFATELHDVFCIQYTSGTTALPKGVMLAARHYIATARHVGYCQTVSPSTNFMSAAPFFHCSGSMHAITVCLLAGCILHTMSSWDPERMLDLVERYRGDVSHGIYFRDIMALGAAKARPKLATLRVGHDIGTPEQLRELHDDFGISGISNIYGMTETAGQFTMWHPDDPLEKRVNANGRTQPGNAIRIGDPQTGAARPEAEVGEIQMKGPTISLGYFNRPEANRQSFTPDGWFRSGDLGRLSAQGELAFIARLKDIIRVGGENLAPAEVEQALREVCDLRQVCVVGVPDARLNEVAAAVVVPNAAIDWQVVMTALKSRLAGYKMPRQIFVCEELPTTATNKVQRTNVARLILEGKLQRVV